MAGALVSSSQSGPNFAQQGSVDWVALSNSSLYFSVEVLSRFSKAGVEMVTVAIGQALFSEFKVPAEGQKRLSDAISKLKAFSSYGEVLWFGFGIKHVVRTLCETEQGATCAAICACLSVSYDTHFASKILKAMADASRLPDSLTPSIPQWGALMRVCAGAVADSNFAVTVEGFSRLLRNPQAGCSLAEPTAPEVVAGALLEICKVTNEAQRSVTFEGGMDCGWLAAVAQWLLCLRLEILDCSGEVLYRNSTSGQYAQVTIIRNSSLISQNQESILVRRSYYVPPGKLHMDVVSNVPHYYLQGRSDWGTILRNTFGEAAEELLHPKHTSILTEFLLCPLMPDVENKPRGLMTPWGYLEQSTTVEIRMKFASFASSRLPELGHILNFAIAQDGGLAYTHSDPYQFSPVLSNICSCALRNNCCKHRAGDLTNFLEFGTGTKTRPICLYELGVTIFKFLWILAWCDIDPSIQPSPNGLLILYYGCNRCNHNMHDPVPFLMHQWDGSVSLELLSLFTGFVFPVVGSSDVSAVSDDGICFSLRVLKEPYINPLGLPRIIILPGQIEISGSIYYHLQDQRPLAREMKTELHYNFWLTNKITLKEWKFVAEETLNANYLKVFYEITSCITTEYEYLTFGITDMQRILKSCLTNAHCFNKKVKYIGPSDGSTSTKKLWIGRCYATNAYFSDASKDTAYTLPEQGEWVLILAPKSLSRIDTHIVLVLRGSYKELYHIIFLAHSVKRDGRVSTDCYLTQITNCALCSIFSVALKIRGTSRNVRKPSTPNWTKSEVYIKPLTNGSSSGAKCLGSFRYLQESDDLDSGTTPKIRDPTARERIPPWRQIKSDLEGSVGRRRLSV